MVELKTVNEVRFYSDSNGIIAFYEPGLMNQEVFFHIFSHGYSTPEDGFGYKGVRLRVEPGEKAEIKLKRENIAERLYRITGEGIYRDSVMVNEPVPLKEPVLNGEVMGQDTVESVLYKGKIYWFWGDTNRPAYPLGNFKTSGATSDLPEKGGLSPDRGIDLRYFVDSNGFCKAMCPDIGNLIWIDGLIAIKDHDGDERLIAHYADVVSLGSIRGHGLLIFDDESQTFKKLKEFSLEKRWQCPQGHPFLVKEENGADYYYFPSPFPTVRVEADFDKIQDQSQYEAFALSPENNSQGYEWVHDATPMNFEREQKLVKEGVLKESEARFMPQNIEDGRPVQIQASSVYWNDYRGKWIMVGQQVRGSSSFLGEIWYAESKYPEGPWRWAQKIITHEKYTFYNPAQHPYFDRKGGRMIYLEGTYTRSFSASTYATPRYDYNQIMYRLDLDRLDLNKLSRE